MLRQRLITTDGPECAFAAQNYFLDCSCFDVTVHQSSLDVPKADIVANLSMPFIPSPTHSPVSYGSVVLFRSTQRILLYDEKDISDMAARMLYVMAVQKMCDEKQFERAAVEIVVE